MTLEKPQEKTGEEFLEKSQNICNLFQIQRLKNTRLQKDIVNVCGEFQVAFQDYVLEIPFETFAQISKMQQSTQKKK